MTNLRGEIASCIEDGQLKLANGKSLAVMSGSCKSHVRQTRDSKMPVVKGYVGGVEVDTLRDTGCSGVVVRTDIVAPDQLTGESVYCILMDSTVESIRWQKLK